MSQLKFLTYLGSLVIAIVASLFFFKGHITANPTSSKHLSQELFNEEARLWGKANGPVQARIDFLEQNGNRVRLEGQIRSTLLQLKVQWILPPGVQLVSGSLEETLQQPTDQATVHNRTLVVDVTWPLDTPHLVLRAAESNDPDAIGASTVFNLDPSLQDMEKEEIIRVHMQSRNVQKIVK